MTVEHLIHTDDLIGHECSVECVCGPDMVVGSEGIIFVHQPLSDSREALKWRTNRIEALESARRTMAEEDA